MKSKVFWAEVKDGATQESIAKQLPLLYEALDIKKIIKKDNLVALKIHFGEKGGSSYINPAYARKIVDLVKSSGGKPFLTDTNTLYVGMRSNAVDHLMNAAEHGFSLEKIGAPIIIGDGLRGENKVSQKTEGQLTQKMVHIAGLPRATDVIIALTHVTGHMLTGYGGNLKNIGMGFAARGGKLAQHSDTITPQIDSKKCTACATCVEFCPTKAMNIKDDSAVIHLSQCCGCGECFSVCPYKAINIKWGETSLGIQKKLAEYCYMILRDKPVASFNFALKITSECDCMGKPFPAITPDLGILASLDPVAVDAATIDLLNQKAGYDLFRKYHPQIDYTTQLTYAAEIGLGSKEYELEKV